MIKHDRYARKLLPRIERLSAIAALALSLSVGVAGSALAADDGGGRSVFAFGAGNRALALGGAYAALSSDASAPVWNVAGLGWVTRPELQFTQTSYFGIGMNEQFGSIAVPHWRWGVASLTFRRFAVDGIESRDDRNVLLDSDLTDSQTEFMLGFGRSIGPAWSVGGAVKMRRQELAGFSDSGLGIDLGVIVKPIRVLAPDNRNGERVTLGLSVRNAVQPELRLLQEKVADPVGVRVGTAVYLPLFGRPLLASIDIEKTSQMNARLHSGFELMVHPMLSLRAGVSGGTFASGMGVAYRGATVEYAFEQNNIENVHRFGATFAFGLTVDDRRQAAFDRRENELQTRFDAAFKERQEMRVRDLLKQSDQAMSAEDYDEALELLAVVVALEPGNGAAKDRQLSCMIALGSRAEARGDYAAAMMTYAQALDLDPENAAARSGQKRTRAESNRIAARSQEIRDQFAAAMDAFSDQRFGDARDGFQAVLTASPDDAEAVEMLARTERAIDLRVTELIAQANQLIKWERFKEAQTAIDQVADLSPKAVGLERTRERLEDARRGIETRPVIAAADSTTPDGASVEPTEPITEAQRLEASRLYQQAIVAISQRQSDDAIRYLELVWAIDPNHQRVTEHLKREYLTRGMEYFADGALENAVTMWEAALRIDPNDDRAKGYLSRAKKQAAKTREILGGSR